MREISTLLYNAAKRPPMLRCVFGEQCCVCLQPHVWGISRRKWRIPRTFIGSAGVVCEACQFAFGNHKYIAEKLAYSSNKLLYMSHYTHIVQYDTWSVYNTRTYEGRQQLQSILFDDTSISFLYIPRTTTRIPPYATTQKLYNGYYGSSPIKNTNTIAQILHSIHKLQQFQWMSYSTIFLHYNTEFLYDIATLRHYKHTPEYHVALWLSGEKRIK
jgi:hypothetical protein